MVTEGSQGMSQPGMCHPEGSYSSGQHSWNDSVARAQATTNQTDPRSWVSTGRCSTAHTPASGCPPAGGGGGGGDIMALVMHCGLLLQSPTSKLEGLKNGAVSS